MGFRAAGVGAGESLGIGYRAIGKVRQARKNIGAAKISGKEIESSFNIDVPTELESVPPAQVRDIVDELDPLGRGFAGRKGIAADSQERRAARAQLGLGIVAVSRSGLGIARPLEAK